jgi:hypothetical protein
MWVESAKSGKLLPLDATPVDDGTIVIIEGKAHPITGPLAFGTQRFVSHFAACPQAASWRK